MVGESKQAPPTGAVAAGEEQSLQSLLTDLRDGQKKLTERLDGIVKEGGTITTLTNVVLKVGQDVSDTKSSIDKRIDVLEGKVHPVGRVEKAVLVIGAVAITNLALRLISGGLQAPQQQVGSWRSALQTFAYYMSP
jgi:hypothetical protein